eukprot:162777-Amorphochlora_amoeboformis.AAC.1
MAKGAIAKIPSSTIRDRLAGASGPSKSSSRRSAREDSKRSARTSKPISQPDDLRSMALKAAADAEKKKVEMPKLNIGNISSKKSEEDPAAYHAAAKAHEEERQKELRSARQTSRPMTARRAPPKVRSHLVEEKKKMIADNETEATGLITEDAKGEDVDEDEDQEDDGLLGAGAADQPDASEKHGKLVTDILKFQNQHASQEEEEEKGGNNSGSQFKFGRIKKRGGKSSATFYSAEQIVFLRDKIQQLCRSATPLGKCIDFVCEDMDSMNKELAQWNRLYERECEVQEKVSKETEGILKPLTDQLMQLERAVDLEKRTAVQIQAQ